VQPVPATCFGKKREREREREKEREREREREREGKKEKGKKRERDQTFLCTFLPRVFLSSFFTSRTSLRG
jgi:hypothetical protein